LKTVELINRLHELGVELQAEGDRLICNAPKGVLTPELSASITERKSDILKFLQQVEAIDAMSAPELRRAPRSGNPRLSFLQESLWFLDQMEPGSTAYSMPEAFRLTGPLEVEAFRRAVEELVRRHEALRTTFSMVDGEPVQVIAPEGNCHVPLVDLSDIAEGQREAAARERAEQDAATPFDLAAGPLLRVSLLKLRQDDYVLLLNMHHIISDGWSKVILAEELSVLYDAFLKGKPSPLPKLDFQYADYAQWQREYLQGAVLDRQIDYWKRQLDGAPALLELPIDKPRPPVISSQGRRIPFELSETLSAQLNELSRKEGVTLYQLLLTAFHVLLSRYCRQDDIVTGSPIAGRQQVEFEPLIGFFVNTLVLRSRVERKESFRDLLARVRETTLLAYQHQDLPFERLVEVLNPQRSRAYLPLFQVMFILQNNAPPSLALSGLSVEPFLTESAVSRFDLTLSLEERNGLLSGHLDYRDDLFNGKTIGRMAENFQALLEGIVANPGEQIGALPLLSEAEKRVLEEWNTPILAHLGKRCIHQLFEEQADRTPDAIAVVYEEESLTYRELNEKSNQLAHRLQKHAVGPDVLVGMFFERSLEMVVTLLGILKAGGAYVALDPVLPQERLLYLIEDAQVAALVTQQSLAESLPATSTPTICVDSDSELLQESTCNPTSGSSPENLVYVMYTSGSTGKPKGVGIEHRQLVNYVFGLKERLGLTPGASYATVSTLSADLGNTAVFSALAFGGCLHVIAQERILSGDAMASYFMRHPIDCMKITPSHLAALQNVSDPSRVMPRRWLVLGGEASTLQWIDQLLNLVPGCAIFNHYGPTETTVGVLTFRVALDRPETPSSTLVLGRPLPNSQMFVVDTDLRLVPIGVAGELLIGGAGVGRGYLRRSDLTREKFIRNPFGEGRLYRTGDLVRYLTDGNIEFLGRIDEQVKIRGFRVEIGEVESVLGQHPLVKACAVLATDDGSGEKRLVAYVVGESLDADELRKHLKQTLPEFMVPSVFVPMAKLPLTPNGKLDKRALPAPEPSAGSRDRVYAAPRNKLEHRLTEIWQSVLKVERVGIDDDFFDLGGHSLLAVRLFAKISNELAGELPVQEAGGNGGGKGLRPSLLWEATTIRLLAQRLTRHKDPDPLDRPLMEVQRGGDRIPFVMLTGDWGGLGFYVRNLARKLDARQPLYALMPHDITADGAPRTIEAMADAFLSTLRAAQPTGPYLLGGYSHSGLVAFEMAKRLQEMGERVALLFVIDTGMPDPRLRYLRRTVRSLARALRWSSEQEIEAFLTWKYRLFHARELWVNGLVPAVKYYVRRFVRPSPPVAAAEPWSENQTVIGYLRAIGQYVPAGFYSGRVTVIASMEGRASRSDDPTLGWSKVAADVRVLRVPGDHPTCLTEHVDAVAGHLRSCLEEVMQQTAARDMGPAAHSYPPAYLSSALEQRRS
jgi:amino acid adenylation domain-containing protein